MRKIQSSQDGYEGCGPHPATRDAFESQSNNGRASIAMFIDRGYKKGGAEQKTGEVFLSVPASSLN